MQRLGDSGAIGATEVALASAATTDLSTAKSRDILITGTTTITSFGAGAKREHVVRFAGALTLTHDGTALILPGAANIVTAAGDVAVFYSDASGNWRCATYLRASFAPARSPDVQIFSTAGSFTWTKPAGAKTVSAYVQAAGGGAASGERRATGTASRGGSPGGPGGYSWADYNASDVAATVALVVGAGGTPGASVTTDSATGNAGGAGGSSSFGASNTAYYLVATGGGGGTVTAVGSVGAGRASGVAGTASGSTGGAGTVQATIAVGAGAGGAGAGLPTVPASANGGICRSNLLTQSAAYVGSVGAGSTKVNAVSPTIPFANDYGAFGGGGPGGWSNSDGSAGAGANGLRGGSGGGGGASLNGNASGAGGAGGDGCVIVVTGF